MFLRQFLEMCVAMCVGGGLLNALIFAAGPALTGAIITLAVVLIGLAASGSISERDLRSSAPGFCGPACLVMLPIMLLRLNLYTGRTESEKQQPAWPPLRPPAATRSRHERSIRVLLPRA
jgi:hypothetical protein